MNDIHVEYVAEPTPELFHLSDVRHRGIMGPRGSSKSTAMSWEIWRRAHEQKPSKDDIRRSRWVIVRNTYRELRDTTLNTWLDWFKEDWVGPFNYQHMEHHIKHEDTEFQVLFRALDRPADIAKVLSLEVTGAWFNEAREIPKGIIDGMDDAIGRYPAQKDGGCTWSGIMMDTNPPDDDHWWYQMAEEGIYDGEVVNPADWQFFKQPGGLIEKEGKFIPNPKAENIKNLEPDYYLKRISGKKKDHIRVYYCGRYGFVRDGKPVYPDYYDEIHASDEILKPVSGLTIYVGVDFGLTPAAVFGQKMVTGQWRWIDEIVTEDMGAKRFAGILGPKMRAEYAGFEFEIYGDPSGDDRAQTDETTPFQILQSAGIPIQPAPSNDMVLRTEAVSNALTRMIDGQPGLLVSPKCRRTRKAMAGGYCYKRLQVANEERYENKPKKDRYSHPAEAAQYMMLGAGEGDQVIAIPEQPQAGYRINARYSNHPQGWMV